MRRFSKGGVPQSGTFLKMGCSSKRGVPQNGVFLEEERFSKGRRVLLLGMQRV